jgi:hypothetical protein
MGQGRDYRASKPLLRCVLHWDSLGHSTVFRRLFAHRRLFVKLHSILLLLWLAPAILVLLCALAIFAWDRVRRNREGDREQAAANELPGQSGKSASRDRTVA